MAKKKLLLDAPFDGLPMTTAPPPTAAPPTCSVLDTSATPGYHFLEPPPFPPGKPVFEDVETTGLGRFDRPVGIGLMADDEQGTYLPWGHPPFSPNLTREEALQRARPVLEDPSIPKVVANLPFEIMMLRKEGIELRGDLHDVQIMAGFLDENRDDYKLKTLAHQDCGMPPEERDALARWLIMNGHQPFEVAKAPSDLAGVYCYGDVLRTKRLYDLYEPQMRASSMWEPYRTECALSPILAKSMMHGVRVDVALLKRDRLLLKKDIEERANLLQDMVRSPSFNYASPQHIAAFFTKHGFAGRFTDKNVSGISWDDVTLKTIDHPAAALILELREKTKLLSTYIENILSLQTDGRLYPSIHQMRGEEGGAVTGRMSVSNPSLQNFPGEIRKYLVPDPGMCFLSVDYSQIEYRLFAHYAKSDKLLGEYQRNPWMDYHQTVADLMGIARKPAKSINFGLLYAMGKKHLAQSLGMDPDNIEQMARGEELFKKYHRMFPEVSRLRNEVEKAMKERGWIRDLFGRVRRIADSEKAYKSLNSLIQGGAAGLFKQGVVQAEEACRAHGALSLMYVHDEDVFQLKPENVEPFLKDVVPLMQEFPTLKHPLSVPIRVEAELNEYDWSRHKKIQIKWNGQPAYKPEDVAKCDGLLVME